MKRRDFRPLFDLAEAGGCSLEIAEGGRHMKATLTRGARKRIIVFAKTPSDHRAGKNNLATFRRVIRELAA